MCKPWLVLLIWLTAIVVVVVILVLFVWASGGRDTSDAEQSTDWGRGPTDGGGLGGF